MVAGSIPHVSPGNETWHCLESEEVLALVNSSTEGLAEAEVLSRQATCGLNQLKEPKRASGWKLFLSQFNSLIIWILIAAAIVSGASGEYADAAAIAAVIFLNAAIGFRQEYSAQKSIDTLRKMTTPQAKVRRHGKTLLIKASQIVPGDILELDAGDLVAADARLLKTVALRCIESALTGEAEVVVKQAEILGDPALPLGDRANMVFLGTTVTQGSAEAVVVATGMRTELGKIAGLLEQAPDERTPLQQSLHSFGRALAWASLGIVGLLFILGSARGMEPFELFMTSVSLAVAAVPEGLPAVVTVALAIGVMRMARRRALVRRLAAVETLGSTNIICTDKTGTLTLGEMTVRRIWTDGRAFKVAGEGYGPIGEVRESDGKVASPLPALDAVAQNLIACNNSHLIEENGAWQVIGDPTEGALLAAAAKLGASLTDVDKEMPRAGEIPFDSDRKRHTVVRTLRDGTIRAFTNGAPDILLERCTHILSAGATRLLTREDRAAISQENTAMAARALRVLGCGYRDLGKGQVADCQPEESADDSLVFVALAGMQDPPRPEARKAVAKCTSAGVQVVMITGDHPQTAQAIALELGIGTPGGTALSGIEIEQTPKDALQIQALHTRVYARVTAEHKLRIVRALRATGATVAMTGDGVNDAPAIKGADIGIAMGKSGTEVTKQAADIIISDDNFASIVAAIEEGRGIYANIRKTLQYLLSGNCGELLLMTTAIVIGLPAPLLAIHLLWINLATDGLPALCLASDPIDPDVMRNAPRPRDASITAGDFLPLMLTAGSIQAAVSLCVYYYVLTVSGLDQARTYTFTVVVFMELLRSFAYRSEHKPLWRVPLSSNLPLALVVAASLAFQILSHHSGTLMKILKTSPVPVIHSIELLLLSTVPLLVLETIKYKRGADARHRSL